MLGACLDVLEYEKASFEKLKTVDLPPAFQYLIQSDQVVFRRMSGVGRMSLIINYRKYWPIRLFINLVLYEAIDLPLDALSCACA